MGYCTVLSSTIIDNSNIKKAVRLIYATNGTGRYGQATDIHGHLRLLPDAQSSASNSVAARGWNTHCV